jgi:hypothetical protein
LYVKLIFGRLLTKCLDAMSVYFYIDVSVIQTQNSGGQFVNESFFNTSPKRSLVCVYLVLERFSSRAFYFLKSNLYTAKSGDKLRSDDVSTYTPAYCGRQ